MPVFRRYLLIIVISVGVLLAGCTGANPETAVPKETLPNQNTTITGEVNRTSTVVPASPTIEVPSIEPTTDLTPSPSSSPAPITAEPASPTEYTVSYGQLAYTGEYGNIWLIDTSTGVNQQITGDAVPFQPARENGGGYISYCCALWSSDGAMLAFRREVGQEVEQGIQSSYELWIYDLSSRKIRTFLKDQRVMNFAWQPGSHRIAYDLEIPTDYFINPSPQLAMGIWRLEVDSGEFHELVAPERGYSLLFPKWSGDGRYLSFEEVTNPEGSGKFAYYDMQEGRYVPWDEVIGSYSWSPDGGRIAYDRLSYAPSGNERIWIRDRLGGEERKFSPELESAYAFHPVFSPQGEWIAYLTETPEKAGQRQHILVQEIYGGEPIDLGEYDQVADLIWSGDGTRLIFSSGPYDARKIMEIVVAGGESKTVVNGSQPSVFPDLP